MTVAVVVVVLLDIAGRCGGIQSRRNSTRLGRKLDGRRCSEARVLWLLVSGVQ